MTDKEKIAELTFALKSVEPRLEFEHAAAVGPARRLSLETILTVVRNALAKAGG